MLKRILTWLVGQSPVDRLLLAATVVATLRMMLIHAAFVDFDLTDWPWFMSIEVWSGLAFAVLEGKALAYVSRLWVGLKPESRREQFYWWLLLAGQALLLVSIVGVTAFAATSVRRGAGIDALLGDGGAVVWSMFVTALNPLMVVLIGIARAIDPQEEGEGLRLSLPEKGRGERPTGAFSVEEMVKLYSQRLYELTPPEFIVEFERVWGKRLTLEEASAALLAAQPKVKVSAGKNGKG